MKKFIPFIFFFLSTSSVAQTLVSYNLITSYTTDQIDSILSANGIPNLLLPATYDIICYKVVYNSLDADSLPILASGALFVPVNPLCKIPLASYQHGTISVKTEVPSNLNTAEVLIGETMASDGFAVTMPDYFGLGVSPGLHPYVHAETEARATADLLVVSLQILDSLQLQRNDQLFLLGYSQGGHATMAAHQMIQQSYGSHFTVTASVPMSGPYDISGVQAEVISSNNPYPDPAFLPYVLLAYDSVYHIWDHYADFLAAPYDSILPPLFDGTHELADVSAVMPSIPNQILVPAVLDSFNTDSTYKLHYYLKLNDTYNWTPQNPIRMLYCEADMDVSYLNAFVAYDTFVANGSTVVSKMSSGAFFDHTSCVLPALLNAKYFTDSLRRDKLKLNFEISNASAGNVADGSLTVHVSKGYPPYSYSWSNGGTDSVISGLLPGVYSVTVTDATGCPATSSSYLSVQVGMDELFAEQATITPNPMHSICTIQFPVEGKYQLEISDASGQKILHDEFTGNRYVLLRKTLSSGIYLFTIRKADGIPFVKMVVME